jgi:uroporphyrinogen decarboxylase
VAKLRNDALIRALLRQPTPYTPVWIMRQAGRYLPEYNETRSRAGSFLGLAKNPDLATEVTLQPLARFPLDAAILFSDILTVPDAMGLGLYFVEGEGPKFERPLRNEWEVRNLFVPDPNEHLRYVVDAVAQIRRALDSRVPLIGFAGSPFTLACYMVDGGASADFRLTKAMMYSRPDLLHQILSINARAVTAYLNAQIEAGAQTVMLFDTWGGSLTGSAYREYSLTYMEQVIGGLVRWKNGDRVPNIIFTTGGGRGWRTLLRPERMLSDWTGPPILRRPELVSAIESRSKVIWTPVSYSVHRREFGARCRRCFKATEPVAGMCSI